MKKISAIRNIPYLTIILLTLICILLLSSKNMIMSQASYPEATIVSSAYAVVEGSDSDKEEIVCSSFWVTCVVQKKVKRKK